MPDTNSQPAEVQEAFDQLRSDESYRNFTAKSMLCKRDILRVIAGWVDRLKTNQLDIALCEEARKVLSSALMTLHGKVIAADIPEIVPENTGCRFRYTIDIFRDAIQLGLEHFDDDVEFGEDGQPQFCSAPPEDEDDANEPDGQPEDDTPAYILLLRVAVPSWPIDRWADANGVKIGTARQWASRNRIQTVKENGAIRVSAIQYTPDAYAASSQARYRFHMPHHLPDEFSIKYPGIDGDIFDLMVISGPQDCAAVKDPKVLVIHRQSDTENLRADTVSLTREQVRAMIEDLYECGDINAVTDRFYISPLGDDTACFTAQPKLKLVNKEANPLPHTAIAIDLHSQTSNLPPDSSRPAHDPMANVTIRLTDHETYTEMQIAAKQCLRSINPEAALLRAIFGQAHDDLLISSALAAVDAGPHNKLRPRTEKVVLIKSVSVDTGFPHPEQVIRAIPAILRTHTCFEPAFITAAANSDAVAELFRDAGMAAIEHDDESLPEIYCAFTRDRNILNGLRHKKSGASSDSDPGDKAPETDSRES